MTYELKIGDLVVTVTGFPEGARPDVNLSFHDTSAENTKALVEALGGPAALNDVRTDATYLTASTKIEGAREDAGEHGYVPPAAELDVTIFPERMSRPTPPRPAHPIIEDVWKAQKR